MSDTSGEYGRQVKILSDQLGKSQLVDLIAAVYEEDIFGGGNQ